MKKIHQRKAFWRSRPGLRAVCFVFVVGAVLTGCKTFNTYTAESRPVSRPIVIDGKTDDWQGDLYVVPGERLSIGFINDPDNLYVCLLTSDTFTRFQIMSQGLTVWFDPKGGKEKVFGIKFPLGPPAGQQPKMTMSETGDPVFDEPPGTSMNEFEIVRSEKEPVQRMEFSQAKGLEIKVASSTGLIVYEMKIPLVQSGQDPVAVGSVPGKTVGIGFETGKVDVSKMPRGNRGGMPGGGGAGGRPPMGGGGASGGMGMRGGIPDGLKVWALVQLSTGASGR
ncbi:MAG: hypothetical protein Q8O91_00145, partial [Candidatus Aminicenantes bacterium]|nr:hypothetical protein [Candidatus Aminicenantes bacterium]